MAERKIDANQISDGFQGNTNTFILPIDVGSMVSGDILVSPPLPGGLVYTSIQVNSVGNTAGLALDIGWRGVGEHRDTAGDADVFADGVVIAATARAEMLGKTFSMSHANSRQVTHALTVTLGGTVTADESVEIVVTCVDKGRL